MSGTPARGGPVAPERPAETASSYIESLRGRLIGVLCPSSRSTPPTVAFQMIEIAPAAREYPARLPDPPVARTAWFSGSLRVHGLLLVGRAERYPMLFEGWPARPTIAVERAVYVSVSLDPADGSLRIDSGPKAPLQLIGGVLVGSFAGAFPSLHESAGTVVTVNLGPCCVEARAERDSIAPAA